jgi:N-acetylglucosamine-6-phosphate deacetylase
MMDLVLTGARVVGPSGVLDGGWLGVADGHVAALGPAGSRPPEAREVHALPGTWLLPGFVDVHGHGAVGYDTMDADVDGLRSIAAHHARHGVTSFLPTTWSAGHDATLAALHAIAQVAHRSWDGAEILGAHMEGPYLAPQRCGAQDARAIRRADPSEVDDYLATGVVRLLTLAPELPENLDLVRVCRAAGVTASIGHSDATFDDVVTAVAAGVTHATHTGNAMRPLHHREPGTLGGVLDHPTVIAEVIADGIHLHPAMLRLVRRVKGIDGMALVTDAMSATGRPAGRYRIGDRIVEVRGGAVRLGGGALAGSVLTMDRALRTLVAATGEGIDVLWPVTSRTPAATIGVQHRKGELRPGLDADLVVLDDALEVLATFVAGRLVHHRELAAPSAPCEGGGELGG